MNAKLFIYVFIISLSFTGILWAQPDTSDVIKFSDRKPAELKIEVLIRPSYGLAIGYAYCYYFKVQNVLKGSLNDELLLVTVLAGDKKNEELFNSGNDSTVYVLEFIFNKSNEEYSTAYITGFVDSDKKSWRLISAYKKN